VDEILTIGKEGLLRLRLAMTRRGEVCNDNTGGEARNENTGILAMTSGGMGTVKRKGDICNERQKVELIDVS